MCICLNSHARTFLGHREEALRMLLQIGPDQSFTYESALKACVLAGSISKQAFEDAVKAVASNFIARSKLDEGLLILQSFCF
jgi:hypothetical protein